LKFEAFWVAHTEFQAKFYFINRFSFNLNVEENFRKSPKDKFQENHLYICTVHFEDSLSIAHQQLH